MNFPASECYHPRIHVSPNWKVFMDRIDMEYPQWGKNYLLPFPDDYMPPDDDEAAN